MMPTDREAAIRTAVDALVAVILAAVTEAAPVGGAPDRLLSVPEACAALGGISRSALYEGPIARGELRVIHVGRRVFVPGASIATYIAERSA